MSKESNQPSFSEVYLESFINNNKHCKVSVESNCLIIDSPWARDDARLKSTVNNQDFIGDLNAISLSPKFDAVFHNDTKTVEFIFAYIDPSSKDNKEIIDREFTVHFEGNKYECSFSMPTERFIRLAACFERLPSDTAIKSVPQIIQFKGSFEF